MGFPGAMPRAPAVCLCVCLSALARNVVLVSATQARPPLQQTFRGVMHARSWAPGTQNLSVVGVVAADTALDAIYKVQSLQDGRSAAQVSKYVRGAEKGGVYNLQPFFNETVCYVYPLVDNPRTHAPLTLATDLEATWCQQAYPCITPYYNLSRPSGSAVVAGTPCDMWTYSQGIAGQAGHDQITYCVAPTTGLLVSVNRTYILKLVPFETLSLRSTFTELSTAPDPALFAVPDVGCCDLRPMAALPSTIARDYGPQAPVNDPARIALANEEAAGQWHARASPRWEGVSVGEAASQFTAEMRGANTLPLPSKEHVARRQSGKALPLAFDSREEWGARCPRVAAVRNQGSCGSCWAFSAAETLSDRTCIGALGLRGAGAGAGGNVTLSPEFLMDCDKNDAGCGGGLLDDAWLFMHTRGLPTDSCDPYAYCGYPADPHCTAPPPPPDCAQEANTDYHNASGADSALARFGCDTVVRCCGFCQSHAGCTVSVFEQGICALKAANDTQGGPVDRAGATACTPRHTPPPPPPPTPAPDHCPAKCADGSALVLHKAATRYAVGRPGDAIAMQRDIMAHGPIQVAFQVFSDFPFYHNGTYVRTKSAQGPHGGHAVKIVGWGVDGNNVDYWIVANSWSPNWAGLGGFFHIRRGTNECGIEMTPAAGLAQL